MSTKHRDAWYSGSDSLIEYQLIEMWRMKKVKYLGNRDGWLCAECNFWECDRCDEKIYCDEDVTCQDVYGYDKASFLMVHTVFTNTV